ncbi:MAG: hypothetical protein R3A49_11475 [Acidimicrobiia bacterium]
MAIDEHTRHHVHEWARRTWDEEAADTLMEMLPPVGWADVATKRDLDALEERMGLRFDAVKHEFRGELHAMENRILRSTLRWMVPTVLAGVSASAALARLL